MRGVVPGANAHAHAQRLAHCIGKIAAKRDIVAGDTGNHAAVKLQRLGARCGIGHQCFLQRFAGVQRFQHRKGVVAFAHDGGGALQNAPAFHRFARGPVSLCDPGGCKRAFNHGRRCGMQPGNHLTGGRIDAFDHAACRVFDIFAIDEMAGFGLCAHYSPLGNRLEDSTMFKSIWLRIYRSDAF